MSQENQESVNNSKFHMIRCMIAIAHVDGVFCGNEREYITTMVNRLPLDENQKNIIEQDFESPGDIAELYEEITEPVYRSEVVYFARLVAGRDGNIDSSEEAVVEKLRQSALSRVNMESLREDVKRLQEDYFKQREQEDLSDAGFIMSYLKSIFPSFM